VRACCSNPEAGHRIRGSYLPRPVMERRLIFQAKAAASCTHSIRFATNCAPMFANLPDDTPTSQARFSCHSASNACEFREAYGVRAACCRFFRDAVIFPPSEIVRHVHLIDLKTINCLHLGRRSHAFKPSRRAPRILIGDGNQSMLHGILMNII